MLGYADLLAFTFTVYICDFVAKRHAKKVFYFTKD